MPLLTRKQILEAPDRKTREVEVPEWGGSVLVRGLTGAERSFYELAHVTMNDSKTVVNMENMREELTAMTVVDEDGNSLFTLEDVSALRKKSAIALDRVFTVAQELSGMTKQSKEALEKNSASAPSGASTSA